MRRFKIIFLSMGILLALSASANTDDHVPVDFKVSSQVPKGFENINESKEFNYMEIFVNNINIGAFLSEYNNKLVKIIEVDEIFDKITQLYEIKDLNKNEIKDFLAKENNSNIQFLCINKNKCLKKPKDNKDIYLILDPFNLKIEIFFDISFLKKVENENYDKYINMTTTKNMSFIQNLNLNYNENINDGNPIEFNLNSNSFLSKENKRLNFNWNLTDSSININQANYEQDNLDKKIKFGFLFTESYGNNLNDNFNFFGMSYGSNFDTRKDLNGKNISPVTLNVKNNAKVKIYKDNDLIYTNIFDFGIHNITLSNVPYGTYKLKIVYEYENGDIEEDSILYSRNHSIPTTNDYIWNMSLGYKTKNDSTKFVEEITKEEYFNLSVIKKISEIVAFYGSFNYDNNLWSLSPSLIYTLEPFDLRLLTKFEGDNISYDANINYQNDNSNFQFRYSDVTYEGIKNKTINSYYRYSFENGDSLGFNYGKDISESSEEYYSVSYSTSIFSNRYGNLNTELNFSKNNDEKQIALKLSYNFKGNSDINYKLSSNINNRLNKYDASLNLNNRSLQQNNFHTMKTSIYENGTGNISYNNNYTNHKYLKSNFSLNTTKSNNSSNTSMFGNITTNSVYTSENGFKIGGDTTLKSGVIVNVSNPNKTGTFVVYVNGIEKGEIEANKPLFIPLTSYNDYVVTIESNKENIFTKVVSKRNTVTLYPGNIQDVNFESYNFFIVYTQFVDTKGIPFKNSKIQTESGYFYTDSQGFADIELKKEEKVILINNHKCLMSYTKENDEDILFLDKSICNQDARVDL